MRLKLKGKINQLQKMKFIRISSAISKDRLNIASKASALLTLRSLTRDASEQTFSKGTNTSHIYSAMTRNFFLNWSEPSQDSRASESPACRLPPRLLPVVTCPGPPLVPPPGPPGQLPAGGSLMPRFKCKFPGTARPQPARRLH